MGRTNPTYRNFLQQYEDRWQPYRRALRRDDQQHFDRLFKHARQHADAAGHQNSPDPERAALFSMLLAQQRELAALRERLDDAE